MTEKKIRKLMLRFRARTNLVPRQTLKRIPTKYTIKLANINKIMNHFVMRNQHISFEYHVGCYPIPEEA